MKTITLTAFDKGSSAIFSESIKIDGRTKDQIKESSGEFFERVPFSKWYYEVDTFDEITDEELTILDELELTPIF